MIFLVIFGGLMLILGGFYLANSWQQYREWKTGTVIVVLSLIAVIYGAINLPYFHHNRQSSTQQASSSQVATSQSFSFSNKADTVTNNSSSTQADQEAKEMDVLRKLQKGYAKFGSVSYDDDSKTFSIKPTDKNTVQALEELVQDPSQAKNLGWSNLTKSIKANSSQLKSVLGSGYTLRIVNPDKTSQALYTAKDGKTTYDIANQNN